ncbi:MULTISPECIES: tRNA (adenosine(37)-N6)-threonylcarbamoyltransferase complex ATPase subunit type 1 TsaE [unclassified Mucilaginibacter]|uniref:tRNA (adenosine(37)-N6)-threonylcarbamoyltransferase complex ATPase subunit type 1 TsaE n=1 Tax=unclassified Mucilaginibacter TaxID=2617802 RepID=UPI00095AF2E3|nr:MULTISPECIES: tRNA (adenosine(37)-N6)-threonylcarbamoyltransferase complex ATPase subunit type 1 TsaE [unclassified Mucilaginibacter]OJW17328.1 MAG: tRNA (adenosine(37)-N6)-threonylcarbamoyltransferase complex ATPase subunit type 1 TsaE [Mucilaginibacter sp. 44-25]PLW91623.1 MAG: tRNA (adenosine(37)-N6)-threonylcarbamoyltransferase complex ATPase subunit type 1 TsaE [Mucilaginibacter sp.]PMP65831.1 MAG: tRNA (adenosine(37)-N6)-threonylcarbamoyltransferase complex ATPase subunit type 1 TsaE [M
MDIRTTSLADLAAAAKKVLEAGGSNRIYLFYGEMGAGKTTLIKALCKELGITDEVTSPTFSIVNEYEGTGGPVYHFDFYRLKQHSEALDMGYEEYFYSGNYCFIEWPEKIADLVPDTYAGVRIHIQDNHSRLITVENF